MQKSDGHSLLPSLIAVLLHVYIYIYIMNCNYEDTILELSIIFQSCHLNRALLPVQMSGSLLIFHQNPERYINNAEVDTEDSGIAGGLP